MLRGSILKENYRCRPKKKTRLEENKVILDWMENFLWESFKIYDNILKEVIERLRGTLHLNTINSNVGSRTGFLSSCPFISYQHTF